MRSFNTQQSQRMWTAFKQQEIRNEQKKDKLQLSFNAWLKKTTPSFNWDWPYLVHLQKATEQLLCGDFDFLMICCPPRHGKTEQTTVRLPIFFLDQFPHKNVIVGSYNQTLANKFSRKSRRIARNCLNLNQERGAVEEWETMEGGAYRAVGVGSGITGQGGHLIIIDDPIKNREEANSLVYRDKVWDWFTDDLYTRLEPGGKMILIQTRWSADDLAGRILDSETAHKWRVVSLPALAEAGDELGREVGEALCNDRYTRDNLLAIKKVIGRNFEALYQQRPSVLAGEIIEIDKLRLIKQMPAANEFDFILQSWDTAFKDKEENDYTVGTTWGIKDDGYYILDRWKNKAIYSAVKEEIHRLAYQYNPDVILIEDRASGQSIIQDLQQDRRLPVVAVKADKSKISRAQAITSIVNNGMIFLQKDYVWLSDFLSNLAMFPNGAHDDDVDSFTMALNYITKRFANTLAVYQDYNDSLHLLRDDLTDINIVKIYVGVYIDTIASAVVVGITELQQVIILSEFMSESGIETLLEDEIVPYLINHYKKHSVDFTVRADRPDSNWMEIFDKYHIDYNNISRVDINDGLEIVKKMLTKIIRRMPQIQLYKFGTPLLREGFRGAYHYKNREDPSEINFTEKPVKNKYARLHIALQNSLYFYSDFVYSKQSLQDSDEITAESGQNKVTGY